MNARASPRGFTLLELIMVIALLALALGVLGSGLGRGLQAARERQALGEIVAALRQTRTQAVLNGAARQLQFDLQARSFQVPGQAPRRWPESFALELTTAAELGPAVAFFADGSSSGGHLLIDRKGRRWRIDIGWLTGHVDWQVVQ